MTRTPDGQNLEHALRDLAGLRTSRAQRSEFSLTDQLADTPALAL